jgi:hypothetical protein
LPNVMQPNFASAVLNGKEAAQILRHFHFFLY